MPVFFPLDPVKPDMDMVRACGAMIRKGGVVVFPTTGLYGLGADPFHPPAVHRIFSMKNRIASNPILVLVHDRETVYRFAASLPAWADTLTNRFWPGGLTLVCKAGKNVPESLTAKTGKIGIRIPSHPGALALARASGGAITGTSANISGTQGAVSVRDIPQDMLSMADGVMDCGILSQAGPSSVLDITVYPPAILREGRISQRDIHSTLGISP